MKIELCEYTPAWQDQFESEKQQLLLAIGDNHSIEHMGSTSVEGLCAKPTIDILIGVDHITDSEPFIPKITQLGYDYISEYENQMPERRYFQKLQNGKHVAHIHLVEKQALFWKRHLFFRNILRQNAKYRDQYALLKQDLAQKEWQDRNDYAHAKSEFIQKVEVNSDSFQWETERLIIRLPQYSYLEEYHRLLIDPDVIRFIGDGSNEPLTESKIEKAIEGLLEHFYLFGYTLGFVFLKNSDKLIGRAGLAHIKGKSEEPIEVAYLLDKPYWNQGYETELARYFIDWGFSHIKINQLVGISHPKHETSQKILKKCGMSLVGDYMYGDIPTLMFNIKKGRGYDQ